MRRTMKTLFLSAVGALALVFAMPGSSDATEVTPVVQRHYGRYYHAPHHGYYHVPHGAYYRHWYQYPRRYYYYRPDVRVYRYPHGYYDYYRYHPHGEVQVGPYRFELWH